MRGVLYLLGAARVAVAVPGSGRAGTRAGGAAWSRVLRGARSAAGGAAGAQLDRLLGWCLFLNLHVIPATSLKSMRAKNLLLNKWILNFSS